MVICVLSLNIFVAKQLKMEGSQPGLLNLKLKIITSLLPGKIALLQNKSWT